MQITVNNKSFFVVDTDILSNTNHWKYVNDGTWEPHTFKIFEEFLDINYSYIDMGSWIGSTVLYGGQLSKHVYAVEPDPLALKSLKNNVNLNLNLKNKITLFEGAVSNKDGISNLYNSIGNSTSTMVGGGPCVSIETLSFNSFIEKYKIVDCNFIKMDIEGAEKIVLPSMVSYLEKCKFKPTLYISFHPNFFKGEDRENIKQSLKCYNNFCDAHNRKRLTINNILNAREIIAWI